MTIVDDLAAWLTQIWDGQEESAQLSVELTERAYPSDEFDVRWKWARLTQHKSSGGDGQSFEPGAPSPTEVLARIAADRQILALHSVEWRQRPDHEIGDSDDPWCGACLDEAWPCPTVRLLALPEAHRPGYLEEWKP